MPALANAAVGHGEDFTEMREMAMVGALEEEEGFAGLFYESRSSLRDDFARSSL